MANTKAVHLKSFKKYVIAKSSEEAYDKIVESLSSSEQRIIKETVGVSQWLDYQLWWKLLLAADKQVGRGDLAVIREIGAFDAKENLSTIYKFFIALMNIPAVIKRSPMIWKQYYDTGQMNVISVGKNEAELHLVDFPNLPLHHEEELLGWMGTAVEMTGNRLVSIEHTTCMCKGDDHCTFMIKW